MTQPADATHDRIEAFIARWDGTGMAERANYQSFLSELCDVLDVPRPDPATGSAGRYRFERGVDHHEADGAVTNTRIDLYKQGSFVCEAKQASDTPSMRLLDGLSTSQRRALIRNTPAWTRHMQAALGQAERYARDVPAAEGWPPFLIVCDIGYCIDLYADFSGTGKHYGHFPDRQGFRLKLPDLRDQAIRNRLRAVWMDPLSLDPARRRAEVTRDIAALLARLATTLEGSPARPRHAPQHVATFLMRTIFCMFAQSVELLPRDSFSALLRTAATNLPAFGPLLTNLWQRMDTGGYSTEIMAEVKRFNGGLFRPGGVHGGPDVLPLQVDEIRLLIQAASKDWTQVEPAIFGTLLEKALDAKERGRLGAQFTPRAFVERLVLPTVMEPLRADWDGVRGAAEASMAAAKPEDAAGYVRTFHAQLCTIRVLDPACGSGNFLYVTLELMKRLEGEVLEALAGYAGDDTTLLDLAGATVSPQQFLGIDLNPRAVPVAELVLWIGYLQWHFRTNGKAPPAEPILQDFKTITHADALLSYTRTEEDQDAAGRRQTRWGGRTVLHPITGEAVPDETDQHVLMRPVGGTTTAWPAADFIVGNPPFVAGKDMRAEMGDGYARALWAAYPKVPRSADLAMFFWWRAAQAVADPRHPARRFGFITSNSIRQVFCRRVVADALAGTRALHLVFAIADHPWAQGAGTAAVRIAMTVAAPGAGTGRLLTVLRETDADVPVVELTERVGVIHADMSMGSSPGLALALRANDRLCSPGVKLHGAGFMVTAGMARQLGLGQVPGLEVHIRPYLNGRDIVAHSRAKLVIDLFGLTEAEVLLRFPAVFQHVLVHVKPERDVNNEREYREKWWLFGKTRPEMRPALHGLPRYIVTVETAKHRVFVFQPAAVLPDNMLVCIASDDAFHHGVLSSRIHAEWALAAGGWLGFGNDPRYNKTRCFDPFPFPAVTPAQGATIAVLAEEIDAHRKTVLAARPHLTLTGLYNSLVTLRAGTPLTDAERDVVNAGQTALLRHLHDQLDNAVAAAYGWPADLPAAAIVDRVVALNHARVAEEAAGQVRWLRPAYQAPAGIAIVTAQPALAVDTAAALPAWPTDLPSQYVALRAALMRTGPTDPVTLALQFRGAKPRRLTPMLAALAALGQARVDGPGRYAP